MNPKTPADLLFEQYLTEAGLIDFCYEEPLPGSAKVPDYQVHWRSERYLFEVKGFDPEVTSGFGAFDPYPPIRKKITKAVEKFKDLEEYPCSLVLYYSGPGLILLTPEVILGAMLGKVAFEIPLAADGSGLDDSAVRSVFTTGGKMLRYAKGGRPIEPENTTINAIIVLERYPFGQKRFSEHYDRLQKAAGHELSVEECFVEIERCRGTDRDVALSAVRCIVHENPFARMPLPRDLFVGPYDERYGADGEGRIGRTFAGCEVVKFDAVAT